MSVNALLLLLLRLGRGADYCDQPVCLCVAVCLSASISLELLDRSSQRLLCRSPVSVAGSSFGGVTIRYVLLVL